MSSGIFTILKTNLMNKLVNLASDICYVALLNAQPTFTASNLYWSAYSSGEITGTGYTAGGQAMAGQTVSTVGTTAVWSANSTQWTNASFSTYGAVIYDSTVGTQATLSITASGGVVQATPTIVSGGQGYVVGNVLSIIQTGGSGATVTVSSVGTNGAITGITLSNGGSGYTTSSSVSITQATNLLAVIDFGGALSVATGTFAIIWSTNGIIILS